jgi:hypothetical protein
MGELPGPAVLSAGALSISAHTTGRANGSIAKMPTRFKGGWPNCGKVVVASGLVRIVAR